MLYFYLDNGSNVCGLEFNYKNGEEEGDSGLEEEKEDKELEEGEETKQDKMEGLEENKIGPIFSSKMGKFYLILQIHQLWGEQNRKMYNCVGC